VEGGGRKGGVVEVNSKARGLGRTKKPNNQHSSRGKPQGEQPVRGRGRKEGSSRKGGGKGDEKTALVLSWGETVPFKRWRKGMNTKDPVTWGRVKRESNRRDRTEGAGKEGIAYKGIERKKRGHLMGDINLTRKKEGDRVRSPSWRTTGQGKSAVITSRAQGVQKRGNEGGVASGVLDELGSE